MGPPTTVGSGNEPLEDSGEQTVTIMPASPKGFPRASTPLTSSLINGIQDVRLVSPMPSPMPVDPSPDASAPPVTSTLAPKSSFSARKTSPPSLPPVLSLKRLNPKGLSLSLGGATSFHNSSTPSTGNSTPTPTTAASHQAAGPSQTPLTPGPPRTPALLITSLGRNTYKSSRRPSLLSLITHPPGGDDLAVPPTPGGAPYHYPGMRSRGHARMRSAGTPSGTYAEVPDPRTSQSAYPSLRSVPTIEERGSGPSVSSSCSDTVPPMSTSASLTSSSASATDSLSLSSTSPAIGGESFDIAYPQTSFEPYYDGPVELVPGVWLGAEDSFWRWDVWAPAATRVAVINVAQEIENPFDESTRDDGWEWPQPSVSAGSKKPKVVIKSYPAEDDRPIVDYAHLRWSHGEAGLAEVPGTASLTELMNGGDYVGEETEKWRFWEAIRWLEVRRKAGTPVIIHCQCGVSRSATLAVAYVMTLAAAGAMPEQLNNLRTMQDAYDFVKSKSAWIGPNVSLVFQLVEYARNLSTLLSTHVEKSGKTWTTTWPTLVEVESEDDWAQRRRAFGEDVDGPGGAWDEARALDEAMSVRAGATRRE
ncbi:tyrosine/serine/threonine protein phosphatase [Vanrija albida]|uniref:protein-tyrosine-phosphatase n=1 Tax=Vanrija albida TaxID=181172 RepID=A0ABR3Q181_9TREE